MVGAQRATARQAYSRLFVATDVKLALFVSLAATPPIPNLVLGSLEASAEMFPGTQALTSSGLVAHASLRYFEPELVATDERYGREVVSRDVYFKQWVADMPLNLFPGLEVQLVDGRLVVGHEGPLHESRGAAWHSYPIVGAPLQLHRVIEGGHMFFVGSDGAQQTVTATEETLEVARRLTKLLGSLVERP